MKKLYDSYTVGAAACISILFLVGVLIQSRVYLNHDVSWVLRTASWMLDGSEFGRDIIDPSPPLIWYLSIPPAALAGLSGLSEPTAFRSYAFLIAALILALCWILLKPFRDEGFRFSSAALIVSFAFVVLVRPAGDFGQREHFTVMLGFPYLLLVAGVLRGYAFEKWLPVIVGLLAGIGFAIKPYFLLVPIGVEAYRSIYTRTLRGSFHSDTWAMAAVIVAYVISVLVLTPAYLFEVVPLLQSVYSGFDNPLSEMLPRLEWRHRIGILALGLIFFIGRKVSSYEVVLAVGGVAFLGAYLLQMKGWSYHGYPVFAMIFTLACLSGSLAASRNTPKLVRALMLAIVFAFFVLQSQVALTWYALANRQSGRGGYEIARVARVIDQYAAGGHVYAFTTRLFPGFPTVLYTSAKWGGRFNCQFIVPALVQHEASGQSLTPQLKKAETYLRQAVLEDFEIYKPELVLVDAGPTRQFIGSVTFDDIAFYSQDSRFADVWELYHEKDPIGRYRVFVRRRN